MSILEKILQIESEISSLEIKKMELGREYLKQNCPYKLGERVIIEDESGVTHGIIFKIDFDSHSNIKGMARLGISPINRKGLRIPNRNSFFVTDVITIRPFN